MTPIDKSLSSHPSSPTYSAAPQCTSLEKVHLVAMAVFGIAMFAIGVLSFFGASSWTSYSLSSLGMVSDTAAYSCMALGGIALVVDVIFLLSLIHPRSPAKKEEASSRVPARNETSSIESLSTSDTEANPSSSIITTYSTMGLKLGLKKYYLEVVTKNALTILQYDKEGEVSHVSFKDEALADQRVTQLIASGYQLYDYEKSFLRLFYTYCKPNEYWATGSEDKFVLFSRSSSNKETYHHFTDEGEWRQQIEKLTQEGYVDGYARFNSKELLVSQIPEIERAQLYREVQENPDVVSIRKALAGGEAGYSIIPLFFPYHLVMLQVDPEDKGTSSSLVDAFAIGKQVEIYHTRYKNLGYSCKEEILHEDFFLF